MDFVLDNSVVMSWCFPDENNPYSEMVLDSLMQAKAFAPTLWPLEVTNVLLVGERRKRLSTSDSLRFLELLKNLPIVVVKEHFPSPQTLLSLARDQQLSTYDGSYLDLAIRLNLPLATTDKALLGAAKKLDIPIYGQKK